MHFYFTHQKNLYSVQYDSLKRTLLQFDLPSFCKVALLVISMMVLSTHTTQAQAPSVQWNKTFNPFSDNDLNGADRLLPTSDGGHLLVGVRRTESEDGLTLRHCLLVKTDASGNQIWYNSTYISADPFALKSALQTSDGGYLLAGFHNIDTFEWLVIKIDASGNKLWQKTFSGETSTNDFITLAIQTADGGYLLGGYNSSGIGGDKTQANKGGDDYWIIKLTGDGTKQWDKSFGGSNDDKLYWAIQTTDGGYLLAGSSTSGISADKSESSRGEVDYWIVKISNSGSKQWDKTFGGNLTEELHAVIQTLDGGYLLSGASNSNASGDKTGSNRGLDDYWVVKITSSGSKQWDRTFGGSNYDGQALPIQTSDGNYLLAGTSYSPISGDKTASNAEGSAWLVKLSSVGTKQWDKTYNIGLSRAVQSRDGGYALAGSGSSPGFRLVKTFQEAPKSTDYVMSATGRATCSGTFYDPGFMGYYANSQNITQTYTPTTAGSKLQFVFSTFSLETNYDYLYIYDGATTGAPLIGVYTGSNNPGTITATNSSGQLTFRFVSNASLTFQGWRASISCVAAPPVLAQWNKRFGGSGKDNFTTMIQTADGGYLLAGHSQSSTSGDRTESTRGSFDYWVVKINSSGTKQWDKRFGGTGDDLVNSVVQTSDGGYLLAGNSSSSISGDKTQSSRGGVDFWVVKISSTGIKQWDRRFGGAGTENLRSVIRTSDGGYLLNGNSNSLAGGDKSESNRGGQDSWIVKISATGTKLWDKRYGGSLDDASKIVLQTTDGGYLLAGNSASGADGDKTQLGRGGHDYWVVKVSSTGLKQWDKRFGGTLSDFLNSMVQTTDGGYLLAGGSSSGTGGDKTQAGWGEVDYWVVKINSTGTKVWDKRFGGNLTDDLQSVVRTPDGGFVLAGFTTTGISGDKTEAGRGLSDYWMLKISSAGSKLWDKRFGGSSTDDLRTILLATDGGLVLGGHSSSPIGGDKSQVSQGLSDFWVVKTTVPSATAPLAMQEEEAGTVAIARLAVAEEVERAAKVSIYPNPVADKATISFSPGKAGKVSVQVYDMQGRFIADLYEDQVEGASVQEIDLQAGHLKAGMYMLRLTANGKNSTHKLVMAR